VNPNQKTCYERGPAARDAGVIIYDSFQLSNDDSLMTVSFPLFLNIIIEKAICDVKNKNVKT